MSFDKIGKSTVIFGWGQTYAIFHNEVASLVLLQNGMDVLCTLASIELVQLQQTPMSIIITQDRNVNAKRKYTDDFCNIIYKMSNAMFCIIASGD